jgi:hypothetical protein
MRLRRHFNSSMALYNIVLPLPPSMHAQYAHLIIHLHLTFTFATRRCGMVSRNIQATTLVC